MSEFNFLPKAIEMVKQAVAEDNAEHYDKAKFLYTQSLEYVCFSFFSMAPILAGVISFHSLTCRLDKYRTHQILHDGAQI